jgi:hypothetical protein
MMTLSMTETMSQTPCEIVPSACTIDHAIVRVIWGRALGSTYQRYFPSGRHSLNGTGGSNFSRPLTCPSCRGSFELRQPHRDAPDRLQGKCTCCGTSARLDVGDDGKITLVGLAEMVGQA